YSGDPSATIGGFPPETSKGASREGVSAPCTLTPTVYLPAAFRQFDPSQPPPVETCIVIDGQADDWDGYPLLYEDPSGDAENGFLDLTTGYAFVNQHALYLLVEAVDVNAPLVQFDMVFQVDAKTLLISWTPGHADGYVGDVTEGYQPLGPTNDSVFAFDAMLEGRVDLRDLGSPESVSLVEINVMVGECCDYPAWRAADQWRPVDVTPVVDEVDHRRWVSVAPKYALARLFRLPLWDWVAEPLFLPPVPDLSSIGRSQSGVIYLQQGGLSVGLSTLHPATGEVTRTLDLPPEGDTRVVGGPGDTAFISVGDEIWQVEPGGSYTVWGQATDGSAFYYTAAGQLLGRSHDRTRVLELFPDGSSREIACGFADINDIVAAPDGTVFVSDWETGSITRVDPDGTQHLLVENVLYRDPMDMEVDPDGNLFLETVTTGFVQVDRDSGTLTPYETAHTLCTIHQSDFVFIAPGEVLFIDPTWSQVTWADLDTGQSGLLISNQGANTWAADIGPDDALYVGAWGCGEAIPAQVVRITDDGAREVYVDGLRDEVRDLAFAPDGALYVATHDFDLGGTPVYYVPSAGGDPVEITGTTSYNIKSLAVDPVSGNLLATEHAGSSVLEFNLGGLVAEHPVQLPKEVFDFYADITPDGTLYAYGSELERAWTGPVVERWVLALDLDSGTSEIVFQYDRQGCCVMGNLSADVRGTLWWVVDPEMWIYRIVPDGETTLFAQNLSCDPAAVVSDSDGDVYFTSPSGIFRIFEEVP
ncbi:MAG: hypothetical protein ACP5GX_08770, partial [Anaerolineae bacterium]